MWIDKTCRINTPFSCSVQLLNGKNISPVNKQTKYFKLTILHTQMNSGIILDYFCCVIGTKNISQKKCLFDNSSAAEFVFYA